MARMKELEEKIRGIKKFVEERLEAEIIKENIARHAVQQRGVSITLACDRFVISDICYGYQATLLEENPKYCRLAGTPDAQSKEFGVGLCFLYLRNVKSFGRNYDRVYRVYRELELNLRIKAAPAGIN